MPRSDNNATMRATITTARTARIRRDTRRRPRGSGISLVGRIGSEPTGGGRSQGRADDLGAGQEAVVGVDRAGGTLGFGRSGIEGDLDAVATVVLGQLDHCVVEGLYTGDREVVAR